MTIDLEKLDVVHDPAAGRFQIEAGRWMAVLNYEMEGNVMVFTHTGVPRPLEGQGVGGKLAKAGLEYARQQAYKIVPACEFMEVYIRRHPEYKDLVAE
jgi:predicted GNAT family acetyltransferase